MSDLNINGLTAELREAVAGLRASSGLEETGVVTRVGDGVAWIYGLTRAGFGEVIAISTTTGQDARAFVLNLNEDEIGAVLLGSEAGVSAGSTVRLTGELLQIPVGPELLGRVVDPLGRPLDGLGPIASQNLGAIERPAPGVMDRQSVNEPLATGIVAIDTMVPIGRGQRELIIGDRQTGKTAITIDTMINQARIGSEIVNVYVAIGQKKFKSGCSHGAP